MPIRSNWTQGGHPPACTCVACQNRRGGEPAQNVSSGRRSSGAKPRAGTEARIRQECEAYVAKLCKKFGVRVPLLIFDDNLQNPGACGEAGQSTIWVQRAYFLRESRGERERVLRHELAHISVHNAAGWGEVEAHGPEFRQQLARLGGGNPFAIIGKLVVCLFSMAWLGGLGLVFTGAYEWAYGGGFPVAWVAFLAPVGFPPVALSDWSEGPRMGAMFGLGFFGFFVWLMLAATAYAVVTGLWRSVCSLGSRLVAR